MSEKSPSVSVIVPSYLPGQELRRFLDTLLGDRCSLDFEVWVVDSSPRDLSPLLGSCLSDRRVRLLKSESRLYPGAARDLAARRSRGEVLVFTDADCVPGPGWLDRLVGGLQASGCDACCGGIENGTPESCTGTAEYLSIIGAYTPRAPARRVRFAPSANMAVRREAYLAAGGFDPDMEKGSDVALGHRLREAGAEIAFMPHAWVIHRNRRGVKNLALNQYRLGRGAAENLLAGRHPRAGLVGRPAGRLVLALGAGPLRFARVAGRSIINREVPLTRLLALLPALALGASCFWAGFARPFLSCGWRGREEKDRKAIPSRLERGPGLMG